MTDIVQQLKASVHPARMRKRRRTKPAKLCDSRHAKLIEAAGFTECIGQYGDRVRSLVQAVVEPFVFTNDSQSVFFRVKTMYIGEPAQFTVFLSPRWGRVWIRGGFHDLRRPPLMAHDITDEVDLSRFAQRLQMLAYQMMRR